MLGGMRLHSLTINILLCRTNEPNFKYIGRYLGFLSLKKKGIVWIRLCLLHVIVSVVVNKTSWLKQCTEERVYRAQGSRWLVLYLQRQHGRKQQIQKRILYVFYATAQERQQTRNIMSH